MSHFCQCTSHFWTPPPGSLWCLCVCVCVCLHPERHCEFSHTISSGRPCIFSGHAQTRSVWDFTDVWPSLSFSFCLLSTFGYIYNVGNYYGNGKGHCLLCKLNSVIKLHLCVVRGVWILDDVSDFPVMLVCMTACHSLCFQWIKVPRKQHSMKDPEMKAKHQNTAPVQTQNTAKKWHVFYISFLPNWCDVE